MKKITIRGVITLLLFCASFSITAQIKKTNLQTNSISDGFDLTEETKKSIELTGYARCLTDENEIELQKKYPNRATQADFENWLAPKLAKIKADRISGKSQQAVYNIPVVIHIVHAGDAIGTGSNITDAQALSQIQVMNEDYRRMVGTPGGANTTGVAVDVEINFCIAQQDESGNATTGIVRHNITPYSNSQTPGDATDWEIRSDVQTMKTNTQWDPTKYLNMWTIKPGGNALDHPFNPGLTGLLGYAQFPSNSGLAGLNTSGGAANTDGVVAAYDAMGTIAEDDGTFMLNGTYNLGRTMTHEVGHWLGLRHIWGDGNCTVDDFCADTPTAGTANYVCNLSANSCNDGPGDLNDQVQNYMDYTNDACMDTFTQDQKDRIVTVMQNSPRRVELNTSNACSLPQPTIEFTTTAPNSTLEGSDCSYQDFTFDFSISEAASASSTASFTVTGTATNNVDFELLNNAVTFAAGSTVATGNSTITLRVYNDSFIETDETLTLSVNVTTSGDAVATLNTYQLTIVNDDFSSSTSSITDVYDLDFESGTGLSGYDRDQDNNSWYVGVTGLDGFGDITGACAVSESNGSVLSTGGQYTPDNYLVSDIFTIPSGATSASVSYVVGSYNTSGSYQEHYSVYFTTITSPSAYTDLEEYVLENDRTVPATGTEIRTHDLSAYAGLTGQIVMRHHNTVGVNGLLLWDSLNVDAASGADIQTVVNIASSDQVNLNSTGTVYTSDSNSSDLILDITNNNSNDFGCVEAYVSRAGTSAQSYNGSTTPNFVTDKTFTVTPTNVLTSTNATIDFYFTDAEILGYEAATGQSRTSMSIIRDNGSTTEVVPVSITAFGSDHKVSGTFTSGINGTYYFGVPGALSTSEFAFDQFSVYPNPTNGEVSIALSTSEDVNISVFDIRGRQIFNNLYSNNNSIFNKTINLDTSSTGIYILKVEAGNKSAFKRIIVK